MLLRTAARCIGLQAQHALHPNFQSFRLQCLLLQQQACKDASFNWLVLQVWTRPEDLPITGRPYYVVEATTGGSDLAGSLAGALAAAALAWKDTDIGTYQTYMGMATTAYAFGKKFLGL